MGSRTEIAPHRPDFEEGSIERYSINKCLVELGAPVEEVYYYGGGIKCPYYNKATYPLFAHLKKSYIYRKGRTIYQRYTRDELWTWAQYLYREKIIFCHPDKQRASKVFWEEYCKYLGQVYDRVQKILKRGRYEKIKRHYRGVGKLRSG